MVLASVVTTPIKEMVRIELVAPALSATKTLLPSAAAAAATGRVKRAPVPEPSARAPLPLPTKLYTPHHVGGCAARPVVAQPLAGTHGTGAARPPAHQKPSGQGRIAPADVYDPGPAAERVDEGVGVIVGDDVDVGVSDGVGDDVDVSDAVFVVVGVGDGEAGVVGDSVGVRDGDLVFVGVTVGVGVSEQDGVSDGVSEAVIDGVFDGVPVGEAEIVFEPVRERVGVGVREAEFEMTVGADSDVAPKASGGAQTLASSVGRIYAAITAVSPSDGSGLLSLKDRE